MTLDAGKDVYREEVIDSTGLARKRDRTKRKRQPKNNYGEKETILWITKKQPAKCWRT